MQQNHRGKRRTGYAYNDSSPRMPAPASTPARVDRVREPGTVKAQLLGKLGRDGYSRLVEQLRERAA